MLNATQEIPLLDLKRQYEPIYPTLEKDFAAFIRAGKFILGPEVPALEEELARFLEVAHSTGVSSGTDALVLALRAAGVKPGDKVLTPSFTFFATISAILAVGGIPVFADIDPKTYCLDPKKAGAVLEADQAKTIRAVIAVHLYGQPADLDPIQALTKKYSLPLIEDAAQGIGATYKGKKIGSIGDLTTFSFYPTKNLGAMGDAGLVATPHAHLNEKVRMLRVHGASKVYVHDAVGGNFRIDTLQAIFLRRFLPHLNEWNSKRQSLAQTYNEGFKNAGDQIVCPVPAPDTTHCFHQYTVRILGNGRSSLRAHLAENKIASCIYYPIPCHQQKALSGILHTIPTLPETEKAANEVLSLPIFPGLTSAEQGRIIETILTWVKNRA